MELTHLEQLLQTLPKVRLSSEADFSIRTSLLSKTTPALEARKAHSWFNLPRLLYIPALATLVLVGSTSAYAYTSPNVTRTSPLYPLRRAVERVIYPMNNERPSARNALAIALRRAQEAETLTHTQKNGAIIPTLREVGVAASRANVTLSKLGTVEELEQTLGKTNRRARTLTETLDAVATTIDTQNSPALDEAALALTTANATLEQLATAELDVEVARAEGKHEVTRTLNFSSQTEGLNNDADELAAALEVATQDFAELEKLLAIRTRPVERTQQVKAHVEQRLAAVAEALEAGNLAQANALLETASALMETGEKFLAGKK